MCGIAGWITASRHGPATDTMARMLQAIAHRGPDDSGVWTSSTAANGAAAIGSEGWHVCLGHQRLAIIDPVGARQPMIDEEAGLALTFNGEIYNFRSLREELLKLGYRFRRDSDTEVLLRAYQQWGEKVVYRLRGMYAFAVWDARAQKLYMARDRFGEKPLFLHEADGALYFASEIKALLQVPQVKTEVDLSSVWDYLAYRYVPGPKTLFTGIRKLMPGTYAVWEKGELKVQRYWYAPDRAPRLGSEATGDVVAAFMARLDEAVELQMVSDVPFGAFLSGGLDSSTIVALMCRHSTRVNTFSVGFGENRYSELAYASEVARHLGSFHHELMVGYKDIIASLPKLVGYRDAPVSEPSDIPIYMLACEASRSVKMVLTGEGSDELLGGYPKHVAERFSGAYQWLPSAVRHRLIEPLAYSLPYAYRRVKTAVTNLNIEDREERYIRWFGALKFSEREKLSRLRMNGAHVIGRPPFDIDPRNSKLRSILYFDQTSWLPDNLLERGDRMTMAASIEARLPFLDHCLAEFVSSLPDSFRVRGVRGKWILRQAAQALLPERILKRPKVGFRVPVNEWFRGELRNFLMDHLKNASSITRQYYDREVLDGILADHVEGRQNHEKLLWALLNLEIWHRQYGART